MYPLRAEAAFEYAARLGYDGIELMVWSESVSQDVDAVKKLSRRYRVPVLSAPPLARALHRHVELNQEIPAGLYTAVAEVLAWVFQLKNWHYSYGPQPDAPSELVVPDELAVPESRA